MPTSRADALAAAIVLADGRALPVHAASRNDERRAAWPSCIMRGDAVICGVIDQPVRY